MKNNIWFTITGYYDNKLLWCSTIFIDEERFFQRDFPFNIYVTILWWYMPMILKSKTPIEKCNAFRTTLVFCCSESMFFYFICLTPWFLTLALSSFYLTQSSRKSYEKSYINYSIKKYTASLEFPAQKILFNIRNDILKKTIQH